MALLLLATSCLVFRDKLANVVFSFLTENGPLSHNEALDTVPFPFYSLDQDNSDQYADLNEIYFFFDYGFEQVLESYFISENISSKERVGLMKTYHNLYPSVKISSSEWVSISWADRGIAQFCEIPSFITDKDQIPGPPYRSCLAWSSGSDHFIFYSVWPESKAADFINSLITIKN